jgi:hypothetical protein
MQQVLLLLSIFFISTLPKMHDFYFKHFDYDGVTFLCKLNKTRSNNKSVII